MTSFWQSVRRIVEYDRAWDEYEAETCKVTMEHKWDALQAMWDDMTPEEQASVPVARRGMTMKEGA